MKPTLRKTSKVLISLGVAASAAAAFFVYENDAIWFDAFDRIDAALWPSRRVLADVRRTTGRMLDELNPFYREEDILKALDRYALTLSPRDIREFYAFGGKAADAEPGAKPGGNFRKVAVSFNGAPPEEAEMKLHGDWSSHWAGRKKSFQLKFPKESPHRGNRKWLFIIPEDRQYLAPLFAAEVAAWMGLPRIRNGFAAVRMNDVFQGTYYVEEHLNEKFLERAGFSGPVLVNLADHWVEDRPRDQLPEDYRGGITYNAQHHTPFDLEISNVEDFESEFKPQVLARMDELFDAARTRDITRFEALVDAETAGAVDAWRVLMGDSHCLAGDNARLVYALSNGKFYPVARSEGHLQPLEYARGSFEYEMCKKGTGVPFLEMLAKSDRIRGIRNRWLRRFTRRGRGILERYDRLAGRYLRVLKRDPTLPHSSRELVREVRKNREAIARNLKALSDQFGHHNVYVNVVTHGNVADLVVTPDTSLDSLEVASFLFETDPGEEITERDRVTLLVSEEPAGARPASFTPSRDGDLAGLFKGLKFGFDFDETMKPKARRYRFRLVFESRARLRVKAVRSRWITTVGGQTLGPGEIYTAVADGTEDQLSLKFQSPAEFVKRYARHPWTLNGSRLSLPAGTHDFEEDIVVPQGLVFELAPGTELRLAPNKSIVSYSPIKIRGERGNGVRVRALDPARPFGTFGVVGEKGFLSEIEHLDLSGGREARLQGMYFSGALSLYHTDVVMRNSAIHGNHADDGLNVKFGKVRLEDNKFFSNFADQVDLDFVSGVVNRCDFAAPRGRTDPNGDGLDLSGSEVLVANCLFKGFPDKALSVGEATRTVLWKNNFSSNTLGIAVKDRSSALFIGNVFEDNRMTVAAYQKKGIYGGGGGVYLFQNTWDEKGEFLHLEGDSASYAPTPSGASFLASLEPAGDNVDFDRLFGDQAFWKADAAQARR